MNNANLLILFFDVYRMHCDAESNGDEDASVFITESYDAVRKYAFDCIDNEKEMTAKDILNAVVNSIYGSMAMDDNEHTSDCTKAIGCYISALIATFDNNHYV